MGILTSLSGARLAGAKNAPNAADTPHSGPLPALNLNTTTSSPQEEEAQKVAESEMVRFYSNKSILITGATGFIGKVLIEKLLYSCPNINRIYVLIRSSKGKSPRERVHDMLAQKPFNIRLKREDILHKVIPIESDLVQTRLGLSESDGDKLIENVDIIFHVAASVKFEAPLEFNMLNNVVATKELLEFASLFKQLKCFVHVSTAYSNCQLNSVGELIYPMQLPSDGNLTNFKVTDQMIDNRPNSYTYTKGLAENIVCQYLNKMNIAIARPSIVTPSIREPAAGWTDSLNGPIGLSLMGSLGILQKIRVNTEVVFDMIPVDIVSNALLAIGWAVTEKKAEFSNGIELPAAAVKIASELQDSRDNKSEEADAEAPPNSKLDDNHDHDNQHDDDDDAAKIKRAPQASANQESGADGQVHVFNLTTGNDNPCSFYHYFSTGRDHALQNPSSRTLRPILHIPKQKGMNMFSYVLYKLFAHLLFAYIVDSLLSLFGHKKMLVKAVNRMHYANELFDYFTSHQWEFVTDNVKKLTALQSAQDKSEFNFNVKTINWNQYSLISWLGCRRFLLKEDDNTIENAKQRYKWVCVIYYFIKLLLVVLTTITIRSCSNSLLLSSFMMLPAYLVIYLL